MRGLPEGKGIYHRHVRIVYGICSVLSSGIFLEFDVFRRILWELKCRVLFVLNVAIEAARAGEPAKGSNPEPPKRSVDGSGGHSCHRGKSQRSRGMFVVIRLCAVRCCRMSSVFREALARCAYTILS
jgi:hypothetical protein